MTYSSRSFVSSLTLTAMLTLFGCIGPLDVYSPSQIHRTVRLHEPGIYIVYYKWRYVIDNYGPNMGLLLKEVEEKDMAAIWKREMALAVPKYLEAKGIVPPDCSNGVQIIRSGETEGGGGWAEFRCR